DRKEALTLCLANLLAGVGGARWRLLWRRRRTRRLWRMHRLVNIPIFRVRFVRDEEVHAQRIFQSTSHGLVRSLLLAVRTPTNGLGGERFARFRVGEGDNDHQRTEELRCTVLRLGF